MNGLGFPDVLQNLVERLVLERVVKKENGAFPDIVGGRVSGDKLDRRVLDLEPVDVLPSRLQHDRVHFHAHELLDSLPGKETNDPALAGAEIDKNVLGSHFQRITKLLKEAVARGPVVFHILVPAGVFQGMVFPGCLDPEGFFQLVLFDQVFSFRRPYLPGILQELPEFMNLFGDQPVLDGYVLGFRIVK